MGYQPLVICAMGMQANMLQTNALCDYLGGSERAITRASNFKSPVYKAESSECRAMFHPVMEKHLLSSCWCIFNVFVHFNQKNIAVYFLSQWNMILNYCYSLKN